MKLRYAYEERCILELARIIRHESLKSQTVAQIEAEQQYQEIAKKIDDKISYAVSQDKAFFFLSKDTPKPIFNMLRKMGYRISYPDSARLNFDSETVQVSF